MATKSEEYKGHKIVAEEGAVVHEVKVTAYDSEGQEVVNMGYYDTLNEAIADMKDFIDKDFQGPNWKDL